MTDKSGLSDPDHTNFPEISLQFWFPKTKLITEQDMGGYLNTSGIHNTLKEALRLEKSAKFFLKCCTITNGMVKVKSAFEAPKDVDTTLENFYLNADDFCNIPHVSLKNIREDRTKDCHAIEPIEWKRMSMPFSMDILNALFEREKITIDNTVKTYIRDLRRCSFGLGVEQIRKEYGKYSRLSLENFLIKSDFIEASIAEHVFSNKIPRMANSWDNLLLHILEEAPLENTTFPNEEGFKICFKKLPKDKLPNFLIDYISKSELDGQITQTISNPTRKGFKCKQWKPAEISFPSYLATKRLREEMLEESFSEIAIYKLKLPFNKKAGDFNGIREPLVPFDICTFKKSKWKLSKHQIYKMEWSPLQSLEISSLYELLYQEEIQAHGNFAVPENVFKFHEIPFLGIDVIDSSKKVLKTLPLPLEIRKYHESEEILESTNASASPKEPESEVSKSKDFDNASTQALQKKRSLIDDGLRSIVKQRKKNRMDTSEIQDISETPLMFLLESTLHRVRGNDTIEQHYEEPHSNRTFKPRIFPHDPRAKVEGKGIIINSSNIQHNHRILQLIIRKTDLFVLEQELPWSCDFIINSHTCFIFLKINKFLQIDSDGKLFYEPVLSNLLCDFKHVVTLVTYPEVLPSVDKNIFWKVQLLLQNPRITCHTVTDTAEDITRWIIDVADKYADNWSDTDFDTNSDDEAILLNIGINIFCAKRIISTTSIYDFFLISAKERRLKFSNILTDTQLARIDQLVSLSW